MGTSVREGLSWHVEFRTGNVEREKGSGVFFGQTRSLVFYGCPKKTPDPVPACMVPVWLRPTAASF